MDTGQPASNPRGLDPDRWVEQHGDCLYRYALLRVHQADTAAEIVQETFLAALRSRGSFAGQSTERTWLMGILKHKLIDHLRARQREGSDDRVEEAATTLDDFFDSRGLWKNKPNDWGADPAEALQRREFHEILEGCLGKLPERLANAFFLRELDGWNPEEICTAIAISPTNLWARLHRARLLLRRCLEIRWFGARREQP